MSTTERPDAQAEWLYSVALQAVVYAWPLYEMRRMQAATSPRKAAGLGFAGDGPDSPMRWCNVFMHTRELLKAGTSRVVMPNNDTLYTNAWLDLSRGPLVIDVPEMGDRYHVLGFLDFFTNPFAHVGTRTTGQRAGQVLVSGPGWSGDVPGPLQAPGRHLRSATPWVWIIGRILVDGEADIANVIALQEGFRIRPLADAQAGVESSAATRFEARCDPRAPLSAVRFVQQANAALRENPAPAADAALVAQFGRIGLGVPPEMSAQRLAQPAIAAAWERALAAARGLLDQSARQVAAEPGAARAGWSRSMMVIGDSFGHDILARAFVARQGIGALAPQEALYPRCETDAEGQPLHGGQRYTMHFAPGQLPPVDAFWSITLYSARDYFLVANPIDRYSIGDRTPGLQHDADGGLTLTIQHQPPLDAKARANWLPAPADAFFLCLRAYLPRVEMVDGRYRLPDPQRVA